MSNNEAWTALKEHKNEVEKTHMRDLFKTDSDRFHKFHIELNSLLFDYSKHKITDDTVALLIKLAQACELENYRDKMFSGEVLNTTEERAVLHTALRGSTDPSLNIDGEIVADFVQNTLQKIETLSTKIRSDGSVTDIISIGIGGSEIGPRIICESLNAYASGPRVHFLSNIDGAPLSELLQPLDPQSTMAIVASKTFTSSETSNNAEKVKDWMGSADNFIGITQNIQAAQDFGIADDHILPMRDWIGGRYSVWGCIGLPVAIAFGFKTFKELLDGAHTADEHFKSAPLDKNIPVIMGLLGIWYRNVFDYRAHAVLPYADSLKNFPTYIQQIDMESNGKHADIKTGPVTFGGVGTDAQHAFFQFLHQGTDIIPADFIAVINSDHGYQAHHTKLLANALAQAQALMEGNGEGQPAHKQFPGNRPSSMFLLEKLDAYNLGLLMALYEHKIFVQGCIWGINSFDQWGVELGKKLAEKITSAMLDNQHIESADSSTQSLVKHIEKRRKQKNS